MDPIDGNYQSASDEVDWPNAERYRVLNQHLIDAARLEGLKKGLEVFDEARLAAKADIAADVAKLCDAARLEGIRLGLEAAAGTLWEREDWEDVIDATDLIRNLDPETIAKEAGQ